MKLMDVISEKVKKKINDIIEDNKRNKIIKDKGKFIEDEAYWKEKESFHLLEAEKKGKARARKTSSNSLGLDFSKKNCDDFVKKIIG